MANVITDERQRSLPLRRPEGWVPKLPRWTLVLPSNVDELSVTYIGIQRHAPPLSTPLSAVAAIESWLDSTDYAPIVIDKFKVVSGRDKPDTQVWACYWTSKIEAKQCLADLDLKSIHKSIDQDLRSSTGLWRETFTPDLTRFETNYSGNDYRPGLAQLDGIKQVEHGLTGYWGAARDRMPASAYDDFPGSSSGTSSPNKKDSLKIDSLGHHLHGTNTTTIAHIRSGQFWESCPQVEREAYETKLEPHLRAGLKDINSNPDDLGDYGLRFLRNVPPSATPEDQSQNQNQDQSPRRETCAAGFFRSLSDLESWAKNCPSHHKIYGGSVSHRNKFGSEAKMRTWHEICVLRPGEASWEYLNCVPETGTLGFQGGDEVK